MMAYPSLSTFPGVFFFPGGHSPIGWELLSQEDGWTASTSPNWTPSTSLRWDLVPSERWPEPTDPE